MIDNFAHRASEWDSPEKIAMADIFVDEMLTYISPQKEWKAFELGAGTGLVGMKVLQQVKSMVFEDTSAAMLNILNQKLDSNSPVEIVQGEIFDYTKQDIDWVFSCMAFHHLPELEKAIQHLALITRQDATVVVGDLLTEDGSFHRFEPIPHKGFELNKLSKLFQNAGFEVIVAKPYNKLRRERTPGNITEYTQFILVAKKN